MSIMHNVVIWIHNGDLELVFTLYEERGAHVLAINNFEVGNAIHFYMLAYHYSIKSWIYYAIFRVKKTLIEEMVPIQWDHRYYSWSKDVPKKEMEELLTNRTVLLQCLL
jgi:hypothetical protein